jgi:Zn-dependent protease/CBS domain-containing protein
VNSCGVAAYFRNELVIRRKWIDASGYADLVALCQFLPSPAFSQVGFALGLLRGGAAGGACRLGGSHASIRASATGRTARRPGWSLLDAAESSRGNRKPCNFVVGVRERHRRQKENGRECLMGWSFKIGTVGGTAVRMHITFALLLVWVWLAHYRMGGAPAAWEGIAFILSVFACVVLHEFGHIAVARYFGIKTPDITLLPIGGVARLERMPEEPYQELLIAIAGPLVNVAIAGLIVLVLGTSVGVEQIVKVDDPGIGFLTRLAGVNIFLVFFNMIPAFPMDGGRVLRAALASRLTWSRATQIAAATGQGLAFVFVFAGLFYNPLLIFIGIFVYLAAATEAQNAQIREVSGSILISDVMVTKFARLDRSASIDEAIEMLLATTQREFPVVDSDGRFEGLLTRDDMIRSLKDKGPDTPVASAMRVDIPKIHYRKSLEESLRLMQQGNVPAIAVVDGADRLIGLMTHETIGEMMMVRAAVSGGFRFGHLRRQQ